MRTLTWMVAALAIAPGLLAAESAGLKPGGSMMEMQPGGSVMEMQPGGSVMEMQPGGSVMETPVFRPALHSLTEQQPEQKPEQKTPPSIAGKWTIYVETSSEPGVFAFKLEGKKLTGSVFTPDGREMPLEGEFAEGKLNFIVTADGANGPMQVTVGGVLKEDGTLSGTLDYGQGQMSWRGERAK